MPVLPQLRQPTVRELRAVRSATSETIYSDILVTCVNFVLVIVLVSELIVIILLLRCS